MKKNCKKHVWKPENRGCRENPGCWSDGRVMIFREICEKCGKIKRVVRDITTRTSSVEIRYFWEK